MATSGIIELADDENAALVALLKRTVDADRFLLSPRVRVLRGIQVFARLKHPLGIIALVAALTGCEAATQRQHQIKLPIIIGLVAMAVFTFVAAETPSNVVAVMAISAAVFFAGGASGMSWALASVAAPAHCTASLGSIQNFGGYLGGALAPTVTGFIVQATGTFVPALLVGAVIALASALAYLVVIPNRPIRSAELGVAAPSARPSGASM